MNEIEKVEFITYDELEQRYYKSDFQWFWRFRNWHDVSLWDVFFKRKIKFTTFKQ